MCHFTRNHRVCSHSISAILLNCVSAQTAKKTRFEDRDLSDPTPCDANPQPKVLINGVQKNPFYEISKENKSVGSIGGRVLPRAFFSLNAVRSSSIFVFNLLTGIKGAVCSRRASSLK